MTTFYGLLLNSYSYGAFFEEPVPDLHREACPGPTGLIMVNYGGVHQSRKVGADC